MSGNELLFQLDAPNLFSFFFFSSQMSRLIYFNESFWLRRETNGALQLLLIHLGTVWICLLWFCFLLTLHQVTKESDLPVLVKIAKFAYSENFIIWHACDVGMLDDSQHTGTQIARLLVDNIWKQVSQILDRQGSSVAQPHSAQFPGRSPAALFSVYLHLARGDLKSTGGEIAGAVLFWFDLTSVCRVHDADAEGFFCFCFLFFLTDFAVCICFGSLTRMCEKLLEPNGFTIYWTH